MSVWDIVSRNPTLEGIAEAVTLIKNISGNGDDEDFPVDLATARIEEGLLHRWALQHIATGSLDDGVAADYAAAVLLTRKLDFAR